ncbi:hypothetical protein CJO90_05605 [Ralstonia solanacearum]|nr:hypothetical protein CJO83_05605 [Ralstonia solanacearum]AXW42579.1 hypothetical protein CJO90_05605 [Ralstonia solanacearum]AXW65893.1 hypothetical protein CJO95_05600 [Ralstonia solanacearum]
MRNAGGDNDSAFLDSLVFRLRQQFPQVDGEGVLLGLRHHTLVRIDFLFGDGREIHAVLKQ